MNVIIEAGSHVAIVGPSGAGKTTLVGLLLGQHRLSSGHILIDDEPLSHERLQTLRRETAWIDPAVQLWNRSLIYNLRYGSSQPDNMPLNSIINQADLLGVLKRLPDGLQTRLGEGGRLVAGGEGQRVRFGRSMLRPEARLVILDEPFRGVDREQRHTLLARARKLWAQATLLCVTHDVGETQDFERVLVVENGRIIEDDKPSVLAAQAGSCYRAMLEAEEMVRERLWSGKDIPWRHLWLKAGRLQEEGVNETN
jgi:ATP-binding cassette subfamily B protein